MHARAKDHPVHIRGTARTGGATQPAGGIWDAWSSPDPRDHPDPRCYASSLWESGRTEVYAQISWRYEHNGTI